MYSTLSKLWLSLSLSLYDDDEFKIFITWFSNLNLFIIQLDNQILILLLLFLLRLQYLTHHHLIISRSRTTNLGRQVSHLTTFGLSYPVTFPVLVACLFSTLNLLSFKPLLSFSFFWPIILVFLIRWSSHHSIQYQKKKSLKIIIIKQFS